MFPPETCPRGIYKVVKTRAYKAAKQPRTLIPERRRRGHLSGTTQES